MKRGAEEAERVRIAEGSVFLLKDAFPFLLFLSPCSSPSYSLLPSFLTTQQMPNGVLPLKNSASKKIVAAQKKRPFWREKRPLRWKSDGRKSERSRRLGYGVCPLLFTCILYTFDYSRTILFCFLHFLFTCILYTFDYSRTM